VSGVHATLLVSIGVRSVTKRSGLTMNRASSHECWNLFASILDSATAGSRSCFSVKGIELVWIELIGSGVGRACKCREKRERSVVWEPAIKAAFDIVSIGGTMSGPGTRV